MNAHNCCLNWLQNILAKPYESYLIMTHTSIQKSTLKFLKDLSANNNREWFAENKPVYLAAHENMSAFMDDLISEMNAHDHIENTSGRKSLYRIYSDARFSKDNIPYRPRFAANLQRATKLLRGGYYLNINPGKSYIACGFFGPNPDDLKRIRSDISYNTADWKKLLNSKKIKTNFGEMTGEKVVSAPRGFQKDHPAIELLRHKSFVFRHEFQIKEVTSDSFVKDVNGLFKSIRPWFDYMSDVLTTDNNGELIV